MFSNMTTYIYSIINGQFVILIPSYYHIGDIQFIGLKLLLLTNLGLIAFFLTFLLPKFKNINIFMLILFFSYQGYMFWYLRSTLRFMHLFPYGIRFKLEQIPYKPNVDYGLFINALNYNFVIITVVLTILCLIYLFNVKAEKTLMIKLICLINFFSMNVFLVDDFLMFFFFLECSVFPMVYLIYFYGPRNERNKAALIYFYFSIFASFLLFIGICFIYAYFKSTAINVIFLNYLFTDYSHILAFKNSFYNKIAFFLIFFGLAIKLPLFPFHIWLPEAHGEANTIGSVFLAGIYLKMAFYGLIQYCIPLFNYEIYKYQNFIYLICVSGIIYCAVTILNGFDLKKFIAYTSVIHMNFTLISLVHDTALSLFGGVFSAIIHSYVTSMLFFIVGAIYDRTHNRNVESYDKILNNESMKNLFKVFTLFLMINASVPIGATFLGELHIFLSIIPSAPIFAAIIFIGISIANLAHFNLITKLYGNKNLIGIAINNNQLKNKKLDLNLPEYIIIIVLIYFSYRYFLWPTYYLYIVEPYIDILIEFGQYHDFLNEEDYLKMLNKYASDVLTNVKFKKEQPIIYDYLAQKLIKLDEGHVYFDNFSNVLYFFKELQVISYLFEFKGIENFDEVFQNSNIVMEGDIPILYKGAHKIDLGHFFSQVTKHIEAKGMTRHHSFDYYRFRKP